MFLFWICLLVFRKYIFPSFLCFLARGNMQGGSHMAVKLSPNEVFFLFLYQFYLCVCFFFFLPFTLLSSYMVLIHPWFGPNSFSSAFFLALWVPVSCQWHLVEPGCQTRWFVSALLPELPALLPVGVHSQPLHTLPCRQMCSSASAVAELETEWTEIGNVCIQLWQSMVLFSQFYCPDTLINTSRISILLFLLC